MDWTKRIDGYCERIGPEFWSEPANAITNGAFFIAGVVLLLHAHRRGRLDGPVGFLGAMMCVIGIGSFLFHTFATVWALLLDTTPIMIFILGFFTVAMNRYFGLSWGRSFMAMLGFLAAMVALSALLRATIGPIIGGSQSYFPALIALLAVGAMLSVRRHPAAASLLAAGGIFAVSLTFRTVDHRICEPFPLGTHFVWHMLNAAVLGTLTLGVIRHGATSPRPAVAA